jgi:alkylhydroperoxidase family enzyme
MARVPYVDLGSRAENPDVADLYAAIAELRGSVHNLHRALANQPSALSAFMGMSRYVRDDSGLAPRLRELAILATGHALDVAYEKYHHARAARRVGVEEAKIQAFPRWWESSLFDATERAVLRYADQVARRRDVGDETFDDLRAHFDNAQIVDLALTVGWYHLCAAILVPLRIEVEAES